MDKLKSRKYIPIYVILFVILLLVLLVPRNNITPNGNNNNQSNNSSNQNNSNVTNDQGLKDESGKTYPCLMDTDTSISSIPNEKFEFVVTDVQDVDWGEVRKDNGVRSFVLSEALSDSQKNKLYLIRYASGASYIKKGITYTYQVCDSKNNTILNSYYESKTINPISSNEGDGNSVSSESQVYGIFMPNVKGTYRYDGLAFYNGQWILVARLEGLKFE